MDLDSIFEAASKKYNVPVNLLKAVAKAESNFNSHATSSCGAMGIMQLMPATAKSLGVTDAYNPEQNIMGGAKYLSQMLNQFNGNTELAVAAYNAGPCCCLANTKSRYWKLLATTKRIPTYKLRIIKWGVCDGLDYL
jgi:soluble lytic murein transglycosylase-like protein